MTARAPLLLVFLLSCTSYFSSSAQSVDPLTGRAIVNLPLGGISYLDLSVSASLSHSGGALRVGEGPGNAGMGWNISIGGAITREVRGLPDEINTPTRKGWLHNSNAQSVQNYSVTDYAFLTGRGYIHDTEPDVFYFQAPGISGKFVFGADGLPKLIPYQDLVIVGAPSGGFTITTNTGITYVFAAGPSVTRQAIAHQPLTLPVTHFQTDYLYYKDELTFAGGWNLTTITSAATGAVATFIYDEWPEASSSSIVTRINAPGSGPTTTVDTLYYLVDRASPKVLMSVTLGGNSIAIAREEPMPTIPSIKFTNDGKETTYTFQYKTIKGKGWYTQARTNPFLLYVRESNTTACVAQPAYAFDYVDVDTTDVTPYYTGARAGKAEVPWNTRWGQDFWGYYNGKDNNKNIPTVYFYQNETGARRFRVTPIPNVSATTTMHGTSTSTNNMLPDTAYTAFGALKEISYPTGGYTRFDYEPNKYWDATTNERLTGPGVRVQKITFFGGTPAYGRPIRTPGNFSNRTLSYQYVNDGGTVTSGRMLYPPLAAFDNLGYYYRSQQILGQGAEVLYSRVRENITGQGYRVYRYDLPNMYPETNPIVPMSRTCSSANPAGSDLGIYTFPFAPTQDLGFKRGLLTRVTEYTQANVITQERRMVYTMPQANQSIKGLKFEAVKDALGNDVYFYSTYLIPYGQSRIPAQEIVKSYSDASVNDSTKVTTAYVYNSKNMVIKSTVTNGDGSVNETNVKYVMDYNVTNPATTDTQAKALQQLNSKNRGAEVVETYSTFIPFGGSAQVTGATLNLYQATSMEWLFQQMQHPGVALTSFAPSSVSAGSNQLFSRDSAYILTDTWDNITAGGLPRDHTNHIALTKTATHYRGDLPVATMVNTRWENTHFNNFESGTVLGWTGSQAQTLDKYAPYSAAGIVKPTGENLFRVSFWVKCTQAADLTLKATNGTSVSVTVNYDTPNQWKYIEQILNVTVASPFTFELSTPTLGPIFHVDDLVVMPKSARVSSSTVNRALGATSQTDDRGRSQVALFDVMGRKISSLDHQRYVTEVIDYQLQKQGKMELSSACTITMSGTSGRFTTDQQITLTAAPTCIPQVSYSWIVTPPSPGSQQTFTGDVVTTAFNIPGEYVIEMTASKAGYRSVSTRRTVCMENHQTYSASLAVSPNNVFHQCNPNGEGLKTFTATVSPAPPSGPGWEVTYAWCVTDINGNCLVGVSNNQATLVYNSPEYFYTAKCTVTVRKPGVPSGSACQLEQTQVMTTNTINITFYPQSQCQ